MSSQLVDQRRQRIEGTLGQLDRLADLMDDQFELPVVHYRIGLDPIIGVIPGGGDWVTWVVGVYIFWKALALDVPRQILAKMVSNLVVDLITGYVPAVGDVFDAVFKANRRNVDLLIDHWDAHRRDGAPRLPDTPPAPVGAASTGARALRYAAGLVVVVVLLAIAALPFAIIWWLAHRP